MYTEDIAVATGTGSGPSKKQYLIPWCVDNVWEVVAGGLSTCRVKEDPPGLGQNFRGSGLYQGCPSTECVAAMSAPRFANLANRGG